MAYLRKDKETFEIDYPLSVVWVAVLKALASLEWSLEENDEANYHAKAKTKGSFLAYGSVLLIDAAQVDEKTTRLSVAAETPVTTITSVVDFGRTRDRIAMFFEQLAKELNG
jgi:hypothetical protein